MSQSLAFWAATSAYAVATALFFLWYALDYARGAALGLAVAGAGAVPHVASLAMRWSEVGHGPFSTRYEVLSGVALVLVVVWLAAARFARGLATLGPFVLPAAFLFMGFAVSTFGLKNEVPIIFRSWWLVLHIGFGKLFAVTVVLAGGCALAFLVKDGRPDRLARLPTLPRLDLYAHQLLLTAFLFLGVMIAAGALWANQSWGRYWGWDPMETTALATWVALGLILHFRVLHRWTGRRMAGLTLVGTALGMVTMFVVATIVPTIHNAFMVGR